MIYDVNIDGTDYRLELVREKAVWKCRLNDREIALDAVLTRANVLSILIDGTAYEVKREATALDLHFWVGSARYAAEVRDPRSLRSRRQRAGAGDGIRKLLAPMPGKVVRLLVEEKAAVQAGQGVLVIEAMKMQNELKSPKNGVVRKILAAPGAAVNAGDVLAIVE
ncbi:MAG TPA: biotin/lipoyl-containing protein [Terriglobales bacterium]|nr:biotin/lipoyl-containing protein [Terriglobales bacterium]